MSTTTGATTSASSAADQEAAIPAAVGEASHPGWVQDETSWAEYEGLSVTQRMDMVKAALKTGVGKLQDEATIGREETVMTETAAALQQAIPPELRPKLPWSALVNLVNTGFQRVQWSLAGRVGVEAEGLQRPRYLAALEEALGGVVRWLPDTAINHLSAPTVDPATIGPELSQEEYQVRRDRPSDHGIWIFPAPLQSLRLRTLSPLTPRKPGCTPTRRCGRCGTRPSRCSASSPPTSPDGRTRSGTAGAAGRASRTRTGASASSS